jgi:hypothetical protein
LRNARRLIEAVATSQMRQGGGVLRPGVTRAEFGGSKAALPMLCLEPVAPPPRRERPSPGAALSSDLPFMIVPLFEAPDSQRFLIGNDGQRMAAAW